MFEADGPGGAAARGAASEARETGRAVEGVAMQGTCEVCGNDYEKAFEVVYEGKRHVFDAFECAIQALAPRCQHCGCRVIGHGSVAGDRTFCCAHCARAAGAAGIQDHA